ncbi:O-methyltransferase protein [Rutstroemia sp. NJR-2017a WRK4]|nr:O-methyltransferase protein [Rutstroemia sp. NJR-2017a WRK4]
MADSYASVNEVERLVANVNEAANKFKHAAGGDANLARRNLHLETQRLLASLEEPNLEINAAVAVEVLKDLNIWSKFEGGKTISHAEIVDISGADEIMIIRIFRQLTAVGVLADIPGPGYALTPLGKPYLNPDHVSFNNFLLHDIVPTILAMPRTMAERGYKAPTKDSGTPFKWLHGEELWTWMGSHPDHVPDMIAGMRSHNAGNLSGDAYPFGKELAQLDIKDDEVAIVDIAGGQGHTMAELRQRYPEVKGRLIVQDLLSTFQAVSGPPPGVEFMPHDMFTPQPVKKAHVYLFPSHLPRLERQRLRHLCTTSCAIIKRAAEEQIVVGRSGLA